MSNENPKTNGELIKEFDVLIRGEGRKIESEEQIKKALWALDVLQQEEKIGPETNLTELIQVVRERKKELQETSAYAKGAFENLTTDEAGVELRKIAEEEAVTAKRLLGYMEAAWALLMPMKMSGYFSEATLEKIRDRLVEGLKIREASVDYDEKEKRNGER